MHIAIFWLPTRLVNISLLRGFILYFLILWWHTTQCWCLVLKYLSNILSNWAFYHRATFELISYQRDGETQPVRSSRLRPCQSSSEASPAWRRGDCWKYWNIFHRDGEVRTWWTGGTPPCPRSHCCPCRWPWRRERPGLPSQSPPWPRSPWSPSPPSPGSPWCCHSSWHTGQTPP